ncbi:histone-lysine N-methyltransferase [Ceratobasidium sp. AG-Ba]|nr:histone-lysine N-methyltransferase [Ceratobasidium sp. AG-Ba]
MPSAGKKRKQKPSSGAPKSSGGAKWGANDEDALQWISSNSELEDYGNLGDKDRWEVDGIVDSHQGENDRMSYKIRWNKHDWCRKDGTSEEWIPAPKKNCTEHQTLIKRYEAKEYVYFDDLPYIVGDEVEHAPYLTGPPCVSKNFWHQTGMNFVMVKHRELEGGDARKAGFTMFDINDRNFARGESSSDESDDDEPPAPPPSTSRQPKREPSLDMPLLPLPPQSPSLGGSRNPSQTADSGPSPLELLGEEWTERAEAVGAAFITFTNDSDTPDVFPKLKKTFEYSEMEIVWGPDAGVENIDDMFVSCRCSDQCDRPHACGCQAPLFENAASGPRALHKFAYNSKGLFRLNHRGVVVECNKRCMCSSSCPNRVAQQPRTVPMDIFMPSIQGWGVRPLRSIKAGQVLGTFTGEILTREKAGNCTRYVSARDLATGKKIRFDDYNRYLFDLDARHKKFTLNCWRYGNWTRFINHSCDPNLKIYPVCYDTLPETGLERLAVVAVRDIRAREELTFDYSPNQASEGTDHGFSIQCVCGTQKCRGLIEMVGY